MSVITTRWFLSLRQKVNESTIASPQFSTPDDRQSKTIVSNETGPDIRFELQDTRASFDHPETTLELGRSGSRSTTADIENDSNCIQEYLAGNEEEVHSYPIWTQKVSPALRARYSAPTAS